MQGKLSCSDLLKYIPDELLSRLEDQTKINLQVKKLSGKIVFKLLLFSLLGSERVSLRIMESLYLSKQFQLFSQRDQRKVGHSGIADRLSKIESTFFEAIFSYLVDRFEALVVSQKKYNLVKFDSTLVNISSKLIQIGIRGAAKHEAEYKSIKYTIGLRNHLPVAVHTFIDQLHHSEEVALREAILEYPDRSNDIVIFDRGLQRRQSFSDFTNHNIAFVTRLKSRLICRRQRTFKQVKGRKTKTLELLEDSLVYLTDRKGKEIDQEFRLITAKSLVTGEPLSFLTNITGLSAAEITEIYKQRWEIEMFFRFLKQELNFSHLVARNQNGISVMVYMTLITSLLLMVYKNKNRISGYKIAKLQFTLELEMDLMEQFAYHFKQPFSDLFTSRNRSPPS